MTVCYCIHASPLGELLLVGNGEALTDVHVIKGKYVPDIGTAWHCAPGDPLLRQAARELEAYFAGQLREFSVPVAPHGTDFQQRAWAALRAIPYGETRSYGAQALAMGTPKAVRATGAANGRNPISIIIPCHRVVAATGRLTGYAGGLDAKEFLLQLEGARRGPPSLTTAQRDWLSAPA